MAKVTVYIPTHNYGQYIKQAVGSVLSQTMTDFELIIIDDGSTDNTREILNAYRNHEKVRIYEQTNKGLNITNNIALRLATGEYIIRLDADDYFDENLLLVLSSTLDNRPEIGLVYPDYYHVDNNGQIIEMIQRKKIGNEVELLDLPAHGACTMFRKDCLTELKGYEEKFNCQDGYELWLRFIKKYQPYNVTIPLFYYRQHGRSLTDGQEKILDTRRRIKKNFVDNENNGMRPKTLGIIPVTGSSIYPKSNPFTQINGNPLIWYTLSQAVEAQNLDRIVLSSEDEQVLAYARDFKGVCPVKRPKELGESSSRIQYTAAHVLDELNRVDAYAPDAVCILNITTPLRKARHIDKAVDTMAIFDVDSVISIQEELSFCYHHRKYGLEVINGTVNGLRNVRPERNAIYRENGAVSLTRTRIIKEGKLLGRRIGHISMLPWESVKINSEYEYWLVVQILKNWNNSMAAY